MSTTEEIVLDPPEAIDGRTEFDLTPFIEAEGMDWGDAVIDAYLSERDRGEVPVDYRLPNREVSGNLKLVSRGTITGQQARVAIQSKVGLWQKEGGVLRRTTNAGSVVYADVVDAGFYATSTPGYQSADNIDLEASVRFTCLPEFLAAEVTLSDHTETTNSEIVFTETSVLGDYPAPVRIVVDDDQAENQRGLIWGVRNRHYSGTATAVSAIGAEGLDVLGAATTEALTGATGGTVVQMGTLWPVWSPMLGTDIVNGGTTSMTHTGTNRIHARVHNRGTVEADVRLSWNVGDLVSPVQNEPWRCPAPGTAGAFYVADLGEVRLDSSPVSVGSHRWQGQIDAKAVSDTVGTTTFSLDRLWIVNADEGYGRLRAPNVAGAASAELQAYDNFSTHTSGSALSNRSAPVGGVWRGTGDANDFTAINSELVYRSVTNDSSVATGGRFVTLDGSSTITGCEVQADVSLPSFTTSGKEIRGGVVARYVDINNWLMAVRRHIFNVTRVTLYKRVGGAAIEELGTYAALGAYASGLYTIKLTVDDAGNAAVYTGPQGAPDLGAAVITVEGDTDLDSGALNDGRVGLYDATDLASGTYTRWYDNFIAYETLAGAIQTDAVIYASQSAQLTTDGHYREDSTGTAYGPVSHVVGDLPRLPVTAEGRTTEVFIKASRGDLDTIPDSGIDNVSARVFYRPSYLHVP